MHFTLNQDKAELPECLSQMTETHRPMSEQPKTWYI